LKIKDILARKGSEVITISENKTIREALSTFAAHRIGSLLVLDKKSHIVGIVAGRDVLMQVLNLCHTVNEAKVGDIMTRKIIIGAPEDELGYVQAIMTKNRIRHLPVVEKNKLAGIVSLGDVVSALMEEYHVENRYLVDYISGKYPG